MKKIVMIKQTDKYSIHIITNISDPELIHHWRRLQQETNCFPQMYYEWCEPWWRLQSGKRELYIVVIKNVHAEIVGIAPLCIEKRFGLRVLRSFPIHFGDFYSFLIENSNDKNLIGNKIINQLTSYQNWHYVKLNQINNHTFLFNTLLSADFYSNKMTGIIVSNFSNMTFDEFLKSLHKNVRKEYRRRMRRIKELGTIQLEIHDTSKGYKAYSDIMKDIYEERWFDDHTPLPDNRSYQCRMESFGGLCDIGKAILCVLKLNNTPIAYRLGFFNKRVFQSWRICFDPKYRKYSPGSMINGLLIEYLIDKNYTQLNYGCGVYDYKLRWSPDGEDSENHSFHAANNTILSRIYLRFQLKWRDKIRTFYYKQLETKWIGLLNRWAREQYGKIKK